MYAMELTTKSVDQCCLVVIGAHVPGFHVLLVSNASLWCRPVVARGVNSSLASVPLPSLRQVPVSIYVKACGLVC